MKIALLDFVFPKGHVDFNLKIANILSRIGDLYSVNIEGNPSSDITSKEKNIRKINVPNLRLFEKNPVSSRIVYLLYMIVQRLQILRIRPDRVVVLTYDVLVYAIGRLIYGRTDIYLFHHNNIDELKNKIKLRAFKTYMNKVNHIVLADYIREYLIKDIGVNASRVYVLPHPLPNDLKINYIDSKYTGELKKFVGISNSNDERIIEEIIIYEKSNSILKDNNCKMILKSKKHKYDNGYLIVTNDYYSKEEYEDLFNSATGILILFPKEYEYRMSGTLFDAFARKKPIIATNIKLIDSLKQIYPNICTSFTTIDELMEIVISKEMLVHIEEISKLQDNHSDQNLENVLYRLMEAR